MTPPPAKLHSSRKIHFLNYSSLLFGYFSPPLDYRLIIMVSPLNPCGKSCSTGTRNETVKKLSLFSAFDRSNYDEITASNLESRSLISNHGLNSRISSKCYQFFNRIENSITFAVTIVMHKSCNLIGTLRSSELVSEGVFD